MALPCRWCQGPKTGQGRAYCSPACAKAARRAKTRARYYTRKTLLGEFKLERGCARCGYRAHPAALDLHHTDPKMKEFKIARDNTMSLARVRAELAKCEVLCANCHRIEHVGGEDL